MTENKAGKDAPETISDEALDDAAGGTLKTSFIGETEKNLGTKLGKKKENGFITFGEGAGV